MATKIQCNFCKTQLYQTFVDLGKVPLVSSYLDEEDLQKVEPFYPLHVYVCEKCNLVQLPEIQTPEQLFRDYPYFSSYSDSWLKHSKLYVDFIIDRYGFNRSNQIIEIASNDGYLLQYFKKKGIPVLGIEPAKNVAEAAVASGIPTVTKFFGLKVAKELVREGYFADLLLGNNVLAHVPDLNDFVSGMRVLLGKRGIITMEFPHLLQLILKNQFDTIFHEHFSYLSLITVKKIFLKHQLHIYDVQEIPTHGGSLRIFARHKEDFTKPIEKSVENLVKRELEAGLNNLNTYESFSQQVQETKHELLSLLIKLKSSGNSIVGYGAPGKGCVLLNYCGIRSDFLDYTVDRNPYKQDLLMPGVQIPIYHQDYIKKTKPDYVLILPWNLKDEIMDQMDYIRSWGGEIYCPYTQSGGI